MDGRHSIRTACLTLAAIAASQFVDQSSEAAPSARRNPLHLHSAAENVRGMKGHVRPQRPEGMQTASPVVGDEVFTERYPDGSVRIEREVTLDADGNYVNHGPFRMWSRNGQLVAEGSYDMGSRVGIWSRWADRNDSKLLNQPPFNRFKSPFLSQASFDNGVMDGEWLIFDGQQRKCSQVSIKDGKRHGLALLWSTDGRLIRQANFDNGVPQGDVLQIKQGAKELSRAKAYLNGREIVVKKATFPRKRQTKTEAGFLAATTVQTEPDNFWSIEFAKYKSEGEDLRHGSWKTWHSNGALRISGNYDHDKKVGRFVYRHDNGQIAAEGQYDNDKQIGQWVWWHPNGQKAATGDFEAGMLVNQWRWWDEEGKLVRDMLHDGTQTLETPATDSLRLDSRDELRIGTRSEQRRVRVRR